MGNWGSYFVTLDSNEETKKLIVLIQSMVKLVMNSIYNLYPEIQNFNQNTSIIHSFFQQIITQNTGTEFPEAGACSVRNTEDSALL